MRARRNLPFAAFCVSALLLPSSGTLWGQCAKPSSVPSPAPPRAAVRPVTDKNGSGATILLRTELDALPVEEMTGLPYASKVRSKDEAGRDVPVMHACAGEQRHRPKVFYRAFAGRLEGRKRYAARNCGRGGESIVSAECRSAWAMIGSSSLRSCRSHTRMGQHHLTGFVLVSST
jgi:hypothetical protein